MTERELPRALRDARAVLADRWKRLSPDEARRAADELVAAISTWRPSSAFARGRLGVTTGRLVASRAAEQVAEDEPAGEA
jgi:hypothetical protein